MTGTLIRRGRRPRLTRYRQRDDEAGNQRLMRGWPGMPRRVGAVGAARLARSAAGHGAAQQLASIADVANDGGMLPEQVWDQNPPSGSARFSPGTPTFSATPLAWTHAQFIRLAWSIQAGRPIEQPAIVACRYVRSC